MIKKHALAGRPSNAAKPTPRSAALPQVRCTPEELAAAQQAANAAGKKLTNYLRSKIFEDQQ